MPGRDHERICSHSPESWHLGLVLALDGFNPRRSRAGALTAVFPRRRGSMTWTLFFAVVLGGQARSRTGRVRRALQRAGAKTRQYEPCDIEVVVESGGRFVEVVGRLRQETLAALEARVMCLSRLDTLLTSAAPHGTSRHSPAIEPCPGPCASGSYWLQTGSTASTSGWTSRAMLHVGIRSLPTSARPARRYGGTARR